MKNRYSEEKAAWILQKGENTLYLGGDAQNNEAFAVFETEEIVLEQVSNQVTPAHHTRPLRQLSKNDPEGTKPIAPPVSANSAEKHGSMKKDDYVWPEVTKTEGQWKLADVKAGKVSIKKTKHQKELTDLYKIS